MRTVAMKKTIDAMTPLSQNALLDYLSDEIEMAETKQDLLGVLDIMRDLLLPDTRHVAVRGLPHIRADLDVSAYRQSAEAPKAPTRTQAQPQPQPQPQATLQAGACHVVKIEIPLILADTFQGLSKRLRDLQKDDPVTFANATSALIWLANGDIKSVC